MSNSSIVSASFKLLTFNIFVSTIIAGFVTIAAGAQEKTQEKADISEKQELRDILCKNGKFVRTLSVKVDAKKNECSTTYTKAGVEKKVGWGQNTKSCIEVLNKLQSILIKNSWACRDVSSVTVSDSSN